MNKRKISSSIQCLISRSKKKNEKKKKRRENIHYRKGKIFILSVRYDGSILISSSTNRDVAASYSIVKDALHHDFFINLLRRMHRGRSKKKTRATYEIQKNRLTTYVFIYEKKLLLIERVSNRIGF